MGDFLQDELTDDEKEPAKEVRPHGKEEEGACEVSVHAAHDWG